MPDAATQCPVQEKACCPPFDPSPWMDREITWNCKLFLKDHVVSFLHMPINTKHVMMRDTKKIEQAGAQETPFIVLSDEKSLWGADLYLSVSKEVAGAETVRLSGKFLTKVFEGPYQNIGQWIKDMKTFVASRNKEMKKLYFYYTACPKCAKKYGKNYVVLLAKVE